MYRRFGTSTALVLATAAPLALAMFASVPAVAQQAVDRAAEEEKIRELDRRWVEAVQAGDFEAAGKFYAEDGLIMPPGAAQGAGTKAAAEFWKAISELPNGSMDFGPTRIEVAESGDMAYEVGTWTLGFDGDQGRVEDEGKYVVVWTKQDGEWRVAADIFNSDRPAQ